MESAGARLKKIRQELGISLEDVHKKTKIHLNILKAIEGDSITNLSEVYLKSFLKIYCKFLGLNPDEYAASFKESRKSEGAVSASVAKEPQGAPVPKKPAVSLAGAAVSPIRKLFSKAVRLNIISFIKKIKGFLIFALIFVLFLFCVFSLGKFISSLAKRRTVQKRIYRVMPVKPLLSAAKPALRQEKTLPKASAQKDGQPYLSTASGNSNALKRGDSFSGIRLGIRAMQNCFVTLKADGKVVFRRTLEKGRFETWQAKEKIELSLGNAGVVELEVNGQIFSKLGRKGQARKNIVITKEGMDLGK